MRHGVCLRGPDLKDLPPASREPLLVRPLLLPWLVKRRRTDAILKAKPQTQPWTSPPTHLLYMLLLYEMPTCAPSARSILVRSSVSGCSVVEMHAYISPGSSAEIS